MREGKQATNAAVIRVHKDRNYTVMSNKHLFQKDLSLKGKGLMSVFLALPDDWNYSIAGLCKILKEGRDALNATIAELKKYGYIDIERKNAEKGRFSFVYHIYERGKEEYLPSDLPCTDNPHTDNAYPENPETVFPTAEQPDSENPQQLNIKILNTEEQNTNEQNSFVKTTVFTCEDLFELYKSICIDFPVPRLLNDKRKEKAKSRLKEYPEREYWETVCRKAQNSKFCRENSFFCFDWILENSQNSLKVFEGNYDDKKSTVSTFPKTNDEKSKYSRCYG